MKKNKYNDCPQGLRKDRKKEFKKKVLELLGVLGTTLIFIILFLAIVCFVPW